MHLLISAQSARDIWCNLAFGQAQKNVPILRSIDYTRDSSASRPRDVVTSHLDNNLPPIDDGMNIGRALFWVQMVMKTCRMGVRAPGGASELQLQPQSPSNRNGHPIEGHLYLVRWLVFMERISLTFRQHVLGGIQCVYSS